jgi:hypothetical protein
MAWAKGNATCWKSNLLLSFGERGWWTVWCSDIIMAISVTLREYVDTWFRGPVEKASENQGSARVIAVLGQLAMMAWSGLSFPSRWQAPHAVAGNVFSLFLAFLNLCLLLLQQQISVAIVCSYPLYDDYTLEDAMSRLGFVWLVPAKGPREELEFVVLIPPALLKVMVSAQFRHKIPLVRT